MDRVGDGHIEVDERGVAWVRGADTKVREIVIDRIGLGLTPEEIREQHPHLSLGQIQAALAFYDAHRDAVDAEILESLARVQALRVQIRPTLTRAQLEARLARPAGAR